MQNQIDVIWTWMTEKGFPNLEELASKAVLRYPKLFDVDDNGDPSENAIEAHQAFCDLDDELVLLKSMREKLQSLEG